MRPLNRKKMPTFNAEQSKNKHRSRPSRITPRPALNYRRYCWCGSESVSCTIALSRKHEYEKWREAILVCRDRYPDPSAGEGRKTLMHGRWLTKHLRRWQKHERRSVRDRLNWKGERSRNPTTSGIRSENLGFQENRSQHQI